MVGAATSVLHDATLTLLDRVGVRVESDLALDLFASHNLRVDTGTKRVYPRPGDVMAAAASAPPTFEVYGRRPENPLVIGGSEVHTLSGGASVRVLTLDGHYMPATWEHLHQFNILLDALPNIHMVLNQVDPQEDTEGHFYQRLAAAMLTDTPKPCCLQAGGAADVAAMVAMGIAIRGSREALAAKPVFITGSNAEPPLCIPGHAAGILIEASRARIPCGIGDYVMMGITAPTTVAGAIIQRNAVQLTALILSQLAQPGAPFYYVATGGSANMRTLAPIMANPHALKISRAAVELGRWYRLPVCGLATTDAKMPDPQAACEMAVSFLTAMEAGANLIQGPTSMMDQMMLSSFTQAVIDNDIVGYLLAARNHPGISEDMLALQVIDDVVNDATLSDLKFAMHSHTVHHLHDEDWRPQVFRYETFDSWRKMGGATLTARAEDLARQILGQHRPEPLAGDLTAEIRRIATG